MINVMTIKVMEKKLELMARRVGPLTRKEYLDACRRCGCEPLPDRVCDSYDIAYGDYSFPEYSTEVVISKKLAFMRLLGIHAEIIERGPQKK